jgi:signal transduction histidine kinase/ABC-type amino acid transport substrate-binding protein/ActR/RegA family two-component response regulator
LVLCLWLALPLAAVPAVETKPAKEPLVRLGVNVDSYPYSYVEAGRLQGFSVDLTEALERVTGLRFERVQGRSTELAEQLIQGRLDVLQTFAHVEAREGIADFSVPYLNLSGTFFVRKGSPAIESLDSMRGKRILVHRGSIGDLFLRQQGFTLEIVQAESVLDSLRRLAAGEADAAAATRLTGMSMIHHLGIAGLEARGPQMEGFSVRFCYGVNPGNVRLLARINEGLAILHQSGEYSKIYDKWFGAIDGGYSREQIVLAVAAGLLVALVVAILAMLRLQSLKGALARSEAHYRGLFEGSPVALLLFRARAEQDGTHLVEQTNTAAMALLGDPTENPEGAALERILHTEEELLRQVLAFLDGKGAAAFDLDRSQGETLSFWHVVLMRIEPHVLVVLSDLSEMRAAQERARRTEFQLRQSQKLEAIGTLASGIAHDFNNILTSIIGNAELVRLQNDKPAEVSEGIAEVLSSSERARRLVRQILTFSRRNEPHRELLRIPRQVDEALGIVRAAAPAHVTIRHLPAESLPGIDGDPTQITQVLVNLCTNALHAMREKPGVLEITEDVVDIDAASLPMFPQLKEGLHVRISVKDSGCGMSPEVVQRVFEPFFTTKGPGEGTGLGLAVVHGIVSSHGGTITVYSQPSEGTIFRIYLPASRRSEALEAESLQKQLLRGRGQRVMVVDDEPSITKALSGMLRHLGYEVTCFNNPSEALQALSEAPHAWHLVLSDLTMPILNGVDFAMLCHDRRPDLPFILASGFLSEETVRRAEAEGIHHLLDKPISLLALSQAVSQALSSGP